MCLAQDKRYVLKLSECDVQNAVITVKRTNIYLSYKHTQALPNSVFKSSLKYDAVNTKKKTTFVMKHKIICACPEVAITS